jgi:hypothetical protein
LFFPTVLYLLLASVAFCPTQPPALVPSVKLVSVLIFPKKKSQKKERPKKGRIKKRVRTGHTTETSCTRWPFFLAAHLPVQSESFSFKQKKKQKKQKLRLSLFIALRRLALRFTATFFL